MHERVSTRERRNLQPDRHMEAWQPCDLRAHRGFKMRHVELGTSEVNKYIHAACITDT